MYTLLAVAEEKSVTRAANKLNLTQPAVSQHLKSLEEKLGCKLFVRTESGMKLTTEGEIVAQYAQKLANLYNNLTTDLRGAKHDKQHIAVGVTQSAELSVVSQVLAKYCEIHPNISIKIISDNITNLYKLLNDYSLDFVIIDGKITDSNYNNILLSTDYLICIVGNDNALSVKNKVTLKELKKQNLILRLRGSGTRDLFEAHLESNNDSIDNYNVILELDNVSAIKDLVTRNYGVTILSQSACQRDLTRKRFVGIPIENMSMVREMNACYRKDYENTAILNEITNIFTEVSKVLK
jgi:DNA-binding transcriptional LysR family regulator